MQKFVVRCSCCCSRYNVASVAWPECELEHKVCLEACASSVEQSRLVYRCSLSCWLAIGIATTMLLLLQPLLLFAVLILRQIVAPSLGPKKSCLLRSQAVPASASVRKMPMQNVSWGVFGASLSLCIFVCVFVENTHFNFLVTKISLNFNCFAAFCVCLKQRKKRVLNANRPEQTYARPSRISVWKGREPSHAKTNRVNVCEYIYLSD